VWVIEVAKKILGLSLFILAVFVVIEISFRVYIVGPVALNPFKANSLNVLMRSEYVQLSEYPDIFFDLKPNMSGYFKGLPFSTSSAGLADREYSRAKPADSYRVAVVGSSWTMPSGVEHQQAWHALIEEKLNNEVAGLVNYEFLNFGVEQYGLRELLGTVRHKVPNWQPDLIVVAVTSYTTSWLWDEPVAGQQLPQRVYPFFESYVLRSLRVALGIGSGLDTDVRPRFGPEDFELQLAQMQRALGELDQLSKQYSVPIKLLFMGYWPLGDEYEIPLREYSGPLSVELLFGNRLFMDSSIERRDYQISKYDRHPNAQAHALIARYLAGELAQRGLLPPMEF